MNRFIDRVQIKGEEDKIPHRKGSHLQRTRRYQQNQAGAQAGDVAKNRFEQRVEQPTPHHDVLPLLIQRLKLGEDVRFRTCDLHGLNRAKNFTKKVGNRISRGAAALKKLFYPLAHAVGDEHHTNQRAKAERRHPRVNAHHDHHGDERKEQVRDQKSRCIERINRYNHIIAQMTNHFAG